MPGTGEITLNGIANLKHFVRSSIFFDGQERGRCYFWRLPFLRAEAAQAILNGMAFTNPFRQKGVWLKGNTHTHTRLSDGALTAREVGREYGARGYDFVFLTDHWLRTKAPGGSRRAPLLIPAEEIDFTMGTDMYHVVCLGLRREWKRGKVRSWKALRDRARRENVTLILAHPYWSGTRSGEAIAAGAFHGVEVYNTICDQVNAKGHAGAFWDDLLDAGQPVMGLAADDLHWAAQAGGGWIMVKAVARSPVSILSAIRRGCFYSTQGPEIKDIAVRGRRIEIACSPVRRINFVANRGNGKVFTAGPRSLTGAAWEAGDGIACVRVECVDKRGRIAWSNPVFF